MSKISKLFSNPKLFFRESKIMNLFVNENYKECFDIDQKNWDETKKLVICIGFNPWKRKHFREYISNAKVAFIRPKTHSHRVLSALKNINEEYTVYIWSYQESKVIYNYLKSENIKIHRVEDGFIRSIGLGSEKTKPLSLVIDDDSIYFNPQSESKLEKIIFDKADKYTDEEIVYAQKLIKLIVNNKISKYNYINHGYTKINDLVEEDRKTILVIGQVEDDMSIKLGYSGNITNLEFLKLVKSENKNATIIFKPHPDILKGNRANSSQLHEYQEIAKVAPPEASLYDLIYISDHVYTITSLSGFEALLMGKEVTCIGSPFYAHWGLTDDRQEAPERRKKSSISLEKLVLAVLVDYPDYYLGNIENTINSIIARKNAMPNDFYEKNHFYNIKNNDLTKINIQNRLQGKNVVIITENSDINQLYLGLNALADNVDVVSMSHNVEKIIRANGTISPSHIRFILKMYLKTLSKIENDSVDLSEIISTNYKDIINTILSDTFTDGYSEKFAEITAHDLEDSIYNNCASYFILEKIIEEYDYVIYNYSQDVSSDGLLKLLCSFNSNDNIFANISDIDRGWKPFKNTISQNILTNRIVNLNTKQTIDPISIDMKKLWNGTKYNAKITEVYLYKPLTICTNLLGRTYGYYPAAAEIIEIAKINNLDLRILPHSILAKEAYSEYKNIVFKDTASKINVEIYPTQKNQILSQNNKLGNIVLSKYIPKIKQVLEHRLSHHLPDYICEYMFPLIALKINSFAIHLAYYFEMLEIIKKTDLLVTTMERTTLSRLATIAAQEIGVKTIGVQGVFISTSRRYRKPIVDTMLVVNQLQQDNFIGLGYKNENIIKVGSANLRKHLEYIHNAPISKIFSETKINILFIMQHSIVDIMLESIANLIALSNDKFDIYLKPHPNQEKVVLDKVSNMISKHSNVVLLEPNEDTYLYIKNCDIIIGIFSNAVYEAILADKDVVVLKLEELHSSIDFTRFGTCAQASSVAELELLLNAFEKSEDFIELIREKRKQYIDDNKYIFDINALVETLNIDNIKRA